MMRQTGFSIIGAIFILVIVSLLGQYLVGITGVQRQTTLLALQTARAYQTANAGIEWGVSQIVNNNGNCAATTILAPPIDNFVTTVNCKKTNDFDEDGVITSIYQITSQSEYSTYGSIDYVSRKLQTMAIK